MQERKLREFIKSRFPGYHDGLDANDDLTGIVDSLGLFELVAFVESEFAVAIPTAMFSPDRFTTIQRTVDFIEELQSLKSRR
jgi:acyl carrier protein